MIYVSSELQQMIKTLNECGYVVVDKEYYGAILQRLHDLNTEKMDGGKDK